MAGLAPGLRILFRIKRPQPVLVIPVRLLDASGGTTVSLVASGAAKFFRIVNLQQFRFGMADKSRSVFIRLLLAFRRQCRRSDLQRLACSHVAGLAAVDNVRIGHVYLDDGRIPIRRLFLQALDLRRCEVDHVVGNVLVHFRFGGGDGLQDIAQFEA